MTRVERAQEFNRRVKAAQNALPQLAATTVTIAAGDAAKGRTIAGVLSEAVPALSVRDWTTGMETKPGDLVRSPDGKYVYVYTGKDAMKHANPTFYPGASGVYYWAIIPNLKDGIPVYPAISGIIVAVKKDQVWYNTTGTTKYRWNDADNASCSWAPGAAGVHQWVKI